MSSGFQNTSLVNAYTTQIHNAFVKLGRPIPAQESEGLAFFLLKAMGSDVRDYHGPEHPLDVSKGLLPIGQLAALFHDIVYVQFDSTWETLSSTLYPFIPNRAFVLDVVGAMTATHDPWLKIIVSMFGFENEQELNPSKGLNEFLSAIIFYQKMRNLLKPEELIGGISCIEATIPFRKSDANGNTPSDRLKMRIQNVQKGEYGKHFVGHLDFDGMVAECKRLIGNDLDSFGAETVSLFLSNSWTLMIENNQGLRNSFYSLSTYRRAIFGNIHFFTSVDSKNLYWTDSENLTLGEEKLIRRTENNLQMAAEYMKAIAISVTLVEAIAVQTGGDCAYELFFGPAKRNREHFPVNIDNLIQLPADPIIDAARRPIYETLKNGRDARSRFDRKTSHLSALLYQKFTSAQFAGIFIQASLYHQEKISAADFINAFDNDVVLEILHLLSKTALSRQAAISRMIADFQQSVSSVG